MTEKSIPTESYQKLLHDIVTPLLTAKLTADLLNEHLPELLATLTQLQTQHNTHKLSEDTIAAILNAPQVIHNNISIVQTKYRELSRQLSETHTSGAQHNSSSQATTLATSHLTIHRVLLVEDEIIHQDIGFQLLSPLFHIDTVKNGIEAIKQCESNQYDLILMDLQMPKMNGVCATEELRKFIPKDTIIIGLTSMPLGEKRNDLLAIGFNEFLEKPLKLENFNHILAVCERR